jgi:hypothetical protein
MGRNLDPVLHRVACATLALLIATLALAPTGEVRRCLRTGAIMPAAHSCCPDRTSQSEEMGESAIGLPCCTTVPARSVVAQLPAGPPDEQLAAPAAMGVLPAVIVDGDHRGRSTLARVSRSRSPPPSERLHRLSTVLRV